MLKITREGRIRVIDKEPNLILREPGSEYE